MRPVGFHIIHIRDVLKINHGSRAGTTASEWLDIFLPKYEGESRLKLEVPMHLRSARIQQDARMAGLEISFNYRFR